MILDALQFYIHSAFFLFLAGYLIQKLATQWCSQSSCVRSGWCEILVTSFLISILLNAFLVLMASLIGIGLHVTKYLLLAVDFIALILIFIFRERGVKFKISRYISWKRDDLLLKIIIITVFIAMTFQGGLLDMLADGWWHMSYAAQMVQDDSLFIQRHPLLGGDIKPVIYPPLWHLQLALISESSGLSLPIIWHFIGAINAVLFLIAVYLLTLQLSNDKCTSLVSILFTLFIVGGLSSYLRVSPWPGNASYIVLFFAFYLTFRGLDEWKNQIKLSNPESPLKTLPYQLLFLLSLTFVAMVGLHGVEVVLYLLAMGAYLLSISVLLPEDQLQDCRWERWALSIVLVCCLLFGVILALYLLPGHIESVFSGARARSPYLNFIFPLLTVLYLLAYRFLSRYFKAIAYFRLFQSLYLLGLLLILFLIIDIRHILDLFFPEYIGRHVPKDSFDQFHNRVYLPFWDHQLRGAMIWSGVITLILGVGMVFIRMTRMNLFLFATSSLVLLTLTSPYFFTLTSFLIPLPSVYRVHLLLISPLILAVFYRQLFSWNDESLN